MPKDSSLISTGSPSDPPIFSSRKPLRDSLIGAWELMEWAAIRNDCPDAKSFPFGPHVRGKLIYSPDGYMATQMEIPEQPPFGGSEPWKGNIEDLAMSAKMSVAYSDTFCTTEDQGPAVHHYTEHCNFPNYREKTMRRGVAFENQGQETFLLLTPEEQPTVHLGETTILRWRKLGARNTRGNTCKI